MKKILLLFIIFLLFAAPPMALATTSTLELKTATVNLTSVNNFAPDSIPSLTFNASLTLAQRFNKIIAKLQNKPTNPTAVIRNPQGIEIISTPIKTGATQLTIPKNLLTPGTFRVTIDDQFITAFTWGVLALNLDQDVYRVGETAYIQMASLSETGHTLCDSSLELKINDQVIPIQNNTTCGANNVTDTPDYFSTYTFSSVGTYQLRLTNLGNGSSITQAISVIAEPTYTIKRIGATRINPFKSDYTMTIKVTANSDWSGMIQEQLPPGFEALTPISWQADLTAGEITTLAYTYRAPKLSPAVFKLGPLSIDDYREQRTWSLASDATFQMQTGYYVGNGVDNRAITGVGFQPQLVFIRDDTNNGTDGIIWKSSVMSGEISALLGETEPDLATDAIQSLDSNGFTLGTDDDVNGANVRFTWVAFAGSDCTSSGTFCVGSYTGDGLATHAITTVGFQPDFVMVKGSGANQGVFRTSSMPTNVGQNYTNGNETTDGTRFKTLDSTGFTVGNGSPVNTNAINYWYAAFKVTANAFAVGTFTGTGVDQSIAVGFKPQYVTIKNANATTGQLAGFNLTESNGDYTSRSNDNANVTNWIKSLDSNGFTVGTDVAVNENTKTIYWVAFAGAPNYSTSGTFKMATGSYSGNGTSQSVTSLGFTPNLVIIKHNDQVTDQFAVFRTSLMKGDRSNYFANSSASFAGGITSIDVDGFTLGSHATVNTLGDTYYWTAFGNAWNPETGTGASDFTIGAYTGNGIDNHEILRMPFQPNLLAIKRDNGQLGGFRTSEMAGDTTGFFTDSAEGADLIQTIGTSSFQVGSAVQVNGTELINYFFAFKTGNAFSVGTYTGNGTGQNITTPGFQPNYLWVKKATGGTARGGILRTSVQAGDAAQPFLNSPTTTTDITSILSTGFSVGTGNLANENTFSYRYAAWMINVAPNTPSLDSPADTATNQSLTPTLKTTTTDTSSDYLRYKIQICTNAGMNTGCQTFDQTSSQTGWSGQNTQSSTAYTSGTQGTYIIQSTLANSTTYYWRSYAIDPGGANTWSSTQGTPYSFTTLAGGGGSSNFNFEGINFENVNIN